MITFIKDYSEWITGEVIKNIVNRSPSKQTDPTPISCPKCQSPVEARFGLGGLRNAWFVCTKCETHW
jgi:hypothetical protein